MSDIHDFVLEVSTPPASGAEPEAHVSQAVSRLLEERGLKVAPQVRLDTHPVIPDFAVLSDSGMATSYVEVKAPSVDLRPERWRKNTHNARQWGYLRRLDSVVYTNGLEWVRYAQGAEIARVRADEDADALATMITDVAGQPPARVETVGRLLDLVVPVAQQLSRAIRGIVELEQSGNTRPALKALWESMNAAHMTSGDIDQMADAVTQTYVFSTITAAHDYGMDVLSPGYDKEIEGEVPLLASVHEMVRLAMGAYPDSTVPPLVRQLKTIVAATDWAAVESNAGKLLNRHLYEDFLARYDSSVRDTTGSYYTPDKLVRGMVNMVAEVAEKHGTGLANSVVVDPAMGTGTFPLAMIDKVAEDAAAAGAPPGMVADAVGRFAGNLHGWELQVAPFAIAHSSIAGRLRELGAKATPNLMIRDSLLDPNEGISQAQMSLLGQTESGWKIGNLAKQTAEFARDTPIQIIGGNPPYDAANLTGWPWVYAQMAEWRKGAAGAGSKTISNLYTAFLRMMCWQAWEKPGTDGAGIVYMVAPSSWIHDKAGAGIREYLRRTADRVWVVDVTPEGYQSPNNVFPISTPVAIVVMQRDSGSGKRNAEVLFKSVTRTRSRDDRLSEILGLSTNSDGWVKAEGDTFIPEGKIWPTMPPVGDTFPLSQRGPSWERKWAISTSESTIRRRLCKLKESPKEDRESLFKNNSTTKWGIPSSSHKILGATGIMASPSVSLENDSEFYDKSDNVKVMDSPMCGAFAIGDTRISAGPRPDLWGSAHFNPDNVFISEFAYADKYDIPVVLTSNPPKFGFGGGGERVYPTYHPDGTPNIAPGLLGVLAAHQGVEVAPNDVAAYIAAATAHPGYHERFKEDLRNPVVRVPITAVPELWAEAVELGHVHMGLTTADLQDPGAAMPSVPGHTSGIAWVSAHGEEVIEGSARRMCKVGADGVFRVGDNVFTGVDPRIMDYKIGGSKVVVKWLERHLGTPYGKSMSPLDLIVPDSWEPGWSQELYRLLLTVEALMVLEARQADLLGRIAGGDLLTVDELAKRGVRWPGGRKDPLRKARWPEKSGGNGLL